MDIAFHSNLTFHFIKKYPRYIGIGDTRHIFIWYWIDPNTSSIVHHEWEIADTHTR